MKKWSYNSVTAITHNYSRPLRSSFQICETFRVESELVLQSAPAAGRDRPETSFLMFILMWAVYSYTNTTDGFYATFQAKTIKSCLCSLQFKPTCLDDDVTQIKNVSWCIQSESDFSHGQITVTGENQINVNLCSIAPGKSSKCSTQCVTLWWGPIRAEIVVDDVMPTCSQVIKQEAADIQTLEKRPVRASQTI